MSPLLVGLKAITSSKACDRLEKKAEAIQDDLDNNHKDEAKFLILSFLHNLGILRGDHCDDEDDSGSIQKNALTSLTGDAKALLAQLGEDDHHH